ncbi:TlpA disulfide reductase family protein [Sinomicrobium weinanense]|uniref:AhpC/TSA family protein n=1 Tax=Sinomicrobium weinanense TaxID=2842200 RepID=A0A926JQV9_9FLAO|nr:TlpA disulfide reductase family protein [Sinomicrobium weinanense]MBC9795827.1 AhpC/TSA family protein [Sinomicrobium weinanense]MBU3121871.1 AhpC/TSA family protein [Sinomicrobium weinanense]
MRIKSVLWLVIIGIFISCNSDKNKQKDRSYTITGNIKGIDTASVKLVYRDMESYESITLDSGKVEKGKFEFQGTLSSPRQLSVIFNTGNETLYNNFFAENADIRLQLDTARYDSKQQNYKSLVAETQGSELQEEYERYQALGKKIRDRLVPYRESYDKLNERYIAARKAENKEEITILEQQLDSIKESMSEIAEGLNSIDEDYIKKHTASHIATYLLTTKIADYGLDKATAYYNAFTPEIKDGVYGKSILKQLEKLKKASPGAEAPLFSTIDINGDTLKLKDFRGQYVLLDFWASWCKPCRKGNPHLIELYKKYNKKGLEIIGISDDDSNHAAWEKAIKDDGIGIWRHVLRGLKVDRAEGYKILDQGISGPYDIHYLPTKILINKEGVIVGRYSSEEEPLDSKLKEVFGE